MQLVGSEFVANLLTQLVVSTFHAAGVIIWEITFLRIIDAVFLVKHHQNASLYDHNVPHLMVNTPRMNMHDYKWFHKHNNEFNVQWPSQSPNLYLINHL